MHERVKDSPGRVVSTDPLVLAERPVVVLVVAEHQDIGRILTRRQRRRLLLLTGVRHVAGRTRDIPNRDYGDRGWRRRWRRWWRWRRRRLRLDLQAPPYALVDDLAVLAHDPAVAAHGHPDGTQHIARATLRPVRLDLHAPPHVYVDDLAVHAHDATVLALGHANGSPHVARPALLHRLMLGPGLRGRDERQTGPDQQRRTPGAKPASRQVERPEEMPHAVISVLARELAAYAPPRPTLTVHEIADAA